MAAGNEAFSDWNSAIAQVIGALETDDLPRLLVDALKTRVSFEFALVIVYRLGRRPLVLFEDLDPDDRGVHVDGYLAGAYLLDPFYRASIEGRPSGVYRLTDVAPKGFRESEYYKSYYIKTFQSDEACFLTELSEDWVANISLGRANDSHPFSRGEIDHLWMTEPLIHELLLRHWVHRQQRRPEAESTPNLHAHVEAALANFGRSLLTKREYEVVQLLLRGHSTRSSARELRIAQETIRLHRKNVYAKLDVASQSELFVLFIDTLAHIAENPDRDPLESREHEIRD
jgi:DNA-binding CsgD family transcriptional regulator